MFKAAVGSSDVTLSPSSSCAVYVAPLSGSFLNHQALKYHSASAYGSSFIPCTAIAVLPFWDMAPIPGPAVPALLPGVSVSHILELWTHASNFIFTFSLSSCLIMFVEDVHSYLRLSNPSAENV